MSKGNSTVVGEVSFGKRHIRWRILQDRQMVPVGEGLNAYFFL